MNIFVAKLNSESTSEDLQKLFSHYGEVSSVKVILDKETGHSKRYGFVEMPNDSEAREALEELNETKFQNSIIVVKESLPRNAPQESRNQTIPSYRHETRKGNNQPGQKRYGRESQSARNQGFRLKKQEKYGQ